MDSSPRAGSVTPSSGTSHATSTRPPPKIPGHTLLRIIGVGSYGEVWLAKNDLGLWRAVKVVRREKFHGDERPYLRDYEGLSHYAPISLLHPSLLPVLQVGHVEAEGLFFCVMELADDAAVAVGQPPPAGAVRQAPPLAERQAGPVGLLTGEGASPTNPDTYIPRTLKQVLSERKRLPLDECLTIGLELTAALEAFHQSKLVHRDVKPSNIIFLRGQAKLADVGLVAKYENTLSLVGSDGYLPQLGAGEPQADLFALGKVLYEMSTGLNRLECPKLPDLGALPKRDRSGILELNRVVLKACHQSPKGRYQSAAELRADLLMLQEGTSLRLRRQLKIATAALLALLVLLPFALFLQRTWIRSEERELFKFLGQAQVKRLGTRDSGWFTTNWNWLGQAAKIRWGREVADQAAAALAGLDVSVHYGTRGMSGSSLAFNPAGELLVGGVSNAPTRRWSSQDSRPLEFTVTTNDGPVCFAADGTALQFTARSLNHFALQEAATGRVRREFQLPIGVAANQPPLLALAGDGSRVAVAVTLANGGGQLAVWDANSGQLLGQRDGAIATLALSPDGEFLVAGDTDGGVWISPATKVMATNRFASGRTAIRSLAFAPDRLVLYDTNAPGRARWLLATGDAGGSITVYEVSTGLIRSQCVGSHYDVLALAFHPDGTLLASGGHDTVQIWDVASRRSVLSVRSPPYWIEFPRGLAFSPDGRLLALVNQQSYKDVPASLVVWAMDAGRGIDTLRGLVSQVSRVWWSPDGKRIAGLAHNWQLGVWDADSGRLLRLIETPKGGSADNAAVTFLRNDRELVFATGTEARHFDLESGAVLHAWPLPFGLADQLRFVDDEHLLLLRREAGPGQTSPKLWRVRNLFATNWGEPVFQQTNTDWVAYDTAFPADGNHFVVMGWRAGDTNRIATFRILDWRTGKQAPEVLTETGYGGCSPITDPAGQYLVYPPERGQKAKLLRLPSGEFVAWIDYAQAVTPSGKAFAFRNPDGGCLLQELGQSANNLTLALDSHMTVAPEFSPDGSRLAWGTRDGTVLVAHPAAVRKRLEQLRTSRR